jgi:hypothetical protein
VAALGLLCLSATAARAQILETYLPAQVLGIDSFLTQPPAEYTAQGIRVGSFLVHPQVSESVGYDNNVYGTAGGPGSPHIETAGTVQAASDWSRDSLNLYANVDNVQTPQVSALNYTNVTASLAGSLDIGQDKLRGSYTYLQYHLLPNQIGSLGLNQVQPVTTNDVRVAYDSRFAQVTITPDFDINTFQYSNTVANGVLQGDGYLSRNVFSPGVTTRYELAPQRDLVFVLRGSSAQFLTVQPGAPERNYIDLQALGGVDFAANGVVRYRALVGYEQRNYSSSQIPTATSPIMEASAIWTPTRLTTVNGTVVHRIEDALESGVYNYTYTDLRVTVDHQLYRNVLLEAYVDIAQANYAQNGGIQTQYGAGASAAWLLNRNVQLKASIAYTDSRAPAPSDYTRNLVLLQLQFGL